MHRKCGFPYLVVQKLLHVLSRGTHTAVANQARDERGDDSRNDGRHREVLDSHNITEDRSSTEEHDSQNGNQQGEDGFQAGKVLKHVAGLPSEILLHEVKRRGGDAVAEEAGDEGRKSARQNGSNRKAHERAHIAGDERGPEKSDGKHGNDDGDGVLESFHKAILLKMCGFQVTLVLRCQKSSAGFGNLDSVVEYTAETAGSVRSRCFGSIAVCKQKLATATLIWVLC